MRSNRQIQRFRSPDIQRRRIIGVRLNIIYYNNMFYGLLIVFCYFVSDFQQQSFRMAAGGEISPLLLLFRDLSGSCENVFNLLTLVKFIKVFQVIIRENLLKKLYETKGSDSIPCQDEKDIALLILRGRFPQLASSKDTNPWKDTNPRKSETISFKSQLMDHVAMEGPSNRDSSKIEDKPVSAANDNDKPIVQPIVGQFEVEAQNGGKPPPKLTKLSSKETSHSDIVTEKSKQEEVKETKGETLKDWELLEMPKPFSCTHCDHKTFNSINMRRHLNSDHSIFQCEICPFETKKTGQLKAHRNSTHMSALFKCHRCNYEATKKEMLESHIVSKHKTKETFNWKGVEKIKRTSLR